MKRWAQHFVPHLAIAAVEVLDVDIDAAFWVLKATDAAQPEPEWPNVLASLSDSFDE
jgi:hypothetical protein